MSDPLSAPPAQSPVPADSTYTDLLDAARLGRDALQDFIWRLLKEPVDANIDCAVAMHVQHAHPSIILRSMADIHQNRDEEFERFWTRYPGHRRGAKTEAYSAFARVRRNWDVLGLDPDQPHLPLRVLFFEGLERKLLSADWNKKDAQGIAGAFVPGLARFMAEEQWFDRDLRTLSGAPAVGDSEKQRRRAEARGSLPILRDLAARVTLDARQVEDIAQLEMHLRGCKNAIAVAEKDGDAFRAARWAKYAQKAQIELDTFIKSVNQTKE